ncbi:MAG: hypothetical protein EKK46_07065 [Rhodocyclaceae bacterium]|nr:MAG: hypothetical protein EKK46_07065 [Rhodocyclaceae bacterium]
MPKRRLLLLDANRISAYLWQNGHVQFEGDFTNGEPGLEAFGQYLKKHHSSLFTLLADVAEEGFQIEDIPRVQGKDRQAIITRRLGQYFYGSPYATAISLGREATGRKDEKILFAALTRPPQLDPWMAVCKEYGTQLTALHAAPFMVAEVFKSLAIKEGRQLLLTISKGGLRQTYFENGEFRFSRLTPLALGTVEEMAQACTTEAEKIYQYLIGQRLLERNARIRTLILAHPADHGQLRQKCYDNHELTFEFVDLAAEAHKRGLKPHPDDSHCDLLLLHLMVRTPPTSQFAPADIRRPYRIWQARFGINAAAAVGLTACLLFAAKSGLNAFSLKDQASQIQIETQRENQRYEAMLKTLPAIPIKIDDLRTLVNRFEDIEKRSPTLRSSLVTLSRALDATPQIEVERLDWILSGNPEESPSRAPGAAAPRPAQPGNGAPQAATAGGYFAILEMEGRLPLAMAGDHRTMLATVEKFRETLSKDAALNVKVLRMPFDTESGKTIKSSDSGSAKVEAPGFAIRVVQKVL